MMTNSCPSSTLIYGSTGVGKTSMLGALALWLHTKNGKRVRLYSAEAGRLGAIQHLIDKGWIEVCDVKQFPHASEVLDAIGKGHWLRANGELGPLIPKEWEGVGAVAYDGMTELADMVLKELTEKGALNQVIGTEKAPAQYMSGKLRLAGANQTYYGIAQRRIKNAVDESQALPAYVVWTARELKVLDQDTKQPLYGPMIAGKAATADCPSWFGQTLHMDRINVKGVLERRVYFQPHLDADTNVPYLSQVRVPVSMAKEVPDFIKVQDEEERMVEVFERLEVLRLKALERLQ